ncbi:MAG: hypothetical protein HY699_21585 [Deltaproteobacteria bacterium]|nr:hypothetical protein [Deltaproteobacteria bacterium]
MLGILIGVLFTFAFGGILLAVFLGARSIEDEITERAREAQKVRADAARIRRFFVVTQPAAPAAGRVDEALLWQLQQYVNAEQVLADEFVLQPSMESLYRESGRRLTTH